MNAHNIILILVLIFSSMNLAYGQATNSDEPGHAVQNIEIVVDSYSFKPDHIKVKVGEPVEIELRSVTSIVPHNFTINDPASGLDISVNVPSGKDVSVTFTPTNTGKFQFYCDKSGMFGSHRKKGMEGTIEVVQ
jgi:plastocyanin